MYTLNAQWIGHAGRRYCNGSCRYFGDWLTEMEAEEDVGVTRFIVPHCGVSAEKQGEQGWTREQTLTEWGSLWAIGNWAGQGRYLSFYQ